MDCDRLLFAAGGRAWPRRALWLQQASLIAFAAPPAASKMPAPFQRRGFRIKNAVVRDIARDNSRERGMDLRAVGVVDLHQEAHQFGLPAHASLGKDIREVGPRGAIEDSASLRRGHFPIALHDLDRESGFGSR